MKLAAKKFLFLFLGLGCALLLSLPYIVFREQVRQMSAAGYAGLIVGCILTNVSLLIPASSTVIVAAAAVALNPWLCILFGALGTCLGQQSAYLCGRLGALGFDEKLSNRLTEGLKRYTFLTVFLVAVAPLPVLDLVGITAGALRLSWQRFALGVMLGKLLKYLCCIVAIFYLAPMLLEFVPAPIEQLLRQLLLRLGGG